MYHFDSLVDDIGKFGSAYPEKIVKKEPMFFSSTLVYAWKQGGEITKAFIEALPLGWEDSIFDSRVHMLMEGWYPCVPGYHHDDVPRGTNGQPDYDTTKYYSEHVMGLVNAEICPTRFAEGSIDLALPSGIVYKDWHLKVEKAIAEGQFKTKDCKSNRLYYFNWQSFHTGQKAITPGWKWFGRVSRKTDRVFYNEMRTQVQVYLEFPMEGW